MCRLCDSRIYLHTTDQSQRIKQLQCIMMSFKKFCPLVFGLFPPHLHSDPTNILSDVLEDITI